MSPGKVCGVSGVSPDKVCGVLGVSLGKVWHRQDPNFLISTIKHRENGICLQKITTTI